MRETQKEHLVWFVTAFCSRSPGCISNTWVQESPLYLYSEFSFLAEGSWNGFYFKIVLIKIRKYNIDS